MALEICWACGSVPQTMRWIWTRAGLVNALSFVGSVERLNVGIGDGCAFGQKLQFGELRLDLQVFEDIGGQPGIRERLIKRLGRAGFLDHFDIGVLLVHFSGGRGDPLVFGQALKDEVLQHLLDDEPPGGLADRGGRLRAAVGDKPLKLVVELGLSHSQGAALRRGQGPPRVRLRRRSWRSSSRRCYQAVPE